MSVCLALLLSASIAHLGNLRMSPTCPWLDLPVAALCCESLCTSRFTDNVMFVHNRRRNSDSTGSHTDQSPWRIRKLTHQRAELGRVGICYLQVPSCSAGNASPCTYLWHTSGEHLELAQLQESVSRRYLDDDVSEQRLNAGSTMQRNGCSNRHFAWILITHDVFIQDRLGGRRILVRQTDDEIGTPIRCTTRQ